VVVFSTNGLMGDGKNDSLKKGLPVQTGCTGSSEFMLTGIS